MVIKLDGDDGVMEVQILSKKKPRDNHGPIKTGLMTVEAEHHVMEKVSRTWQLKELWNGEAEIGPFSSALTRKKEKPPFAGCSCVNGGSTLRLRERGSVHLSPQLY